MSGSATYSSGIFTVNAGGLDIWDASDQFHFVYQAISGDANCCRVDSLTMVNDFTSAGVMIRGALSGSASHGFSAVIASGPAYYRRRLSAGGLTTTCPREPDRPPCGYVSFGRARP